MITSWVLVLIMNGAYQVKLVTMQEFSTKANCELVLKQIAAEEKPLVGICVEK